MYRGRGSYSQALCCIILLCREFGSNKGDFVRLSSERESVYFKGENEKDRKVCVTPTDRKCRHHLGFPGDGDRMNDDEWGEIQHCDNFTAEPHPASHRCLTAPQSHNEQTINNNSRSPGGERDSKGQIIQGEEEEDLRSSTINNVKILLTKSIESKSTHSAGGSCLMSYCYILLNVHSRRLLSNTDQAAVQQ